MKIRYTNRPANRQKGSGASLKTIILMTCVVMSMVTVKIVYDPTEPAEDVAAMAEIADPETSEETGEIY